MSIVLSASVRQNLLSLQSTADLLSTTQNRLATGNKVNSALDNPTNFFTAQGLNNRASDINNLLDSIGNGVQVLQAANTGITSLQKLVDTAKSIANQVLQAPAGYTHQVQRHQRRDRRRHRSRPARAHGLAHGRRPEHRSDRRRHGDGHHLRYRRPNVDTLTELNTALAANNLQARLTTPTGKITITTTNDKASATVGALTGTATGAVKAFLRRFGGSRSRPVADAASQTIRSSLVKQYNDIITQITTTSQDASFNGINLLNGDDLKLTFNETGKSTLNIKGVIFNAAGLGLAPLTSGTDFLDNSSANAALIKLSAASSTLRTQASSLGSNLSVVQIRQDFNKNLINVLQTGSSNLTLADTNEEAANSQALSTRQSIAVSALALANQSQQSVLQLLR